MTVIVWSASGDIIDRQSYDHHEIAEGEDEQGNQYTGTAVFSCGELIEVIDIETKI